MGHLVGLPCLVIRVNGKMPQLNSGKISNGPDPSRLKVWVMAPGINPQLAEVLSEGKENMEWVVEEGGYKC